MRPDTTAQNLSWEMAASIHPTPTLFSPSLLYDFALFQPFEPRDGWLMNIYLPLLPFDGAAS